MVMKMNANIGENQGMIDKFQEHVVLKFKGRIKLNFFFWYHRWCLLYIYTISNAHRFRNSKHLRPSITVSQSWLRIHRNIYMAHGFMFIIFATCRLPILVICEFFASANVIIFFFYCQKTAGFIRHQRRCPGFDSGFLSNT